jgi:hypothetical protein
MSSGIGCRHVGQIPEEVGVIGPAAERCGAGVGEQVGDVGVAFGDGLAEQLDGPGGVAAD